MVAYDIIDIVERAGVRLRGNTNKWCLCPLPFHQHSANPTASFSIFWRGDKQYWKCHGQCNLTGDVIDLIGFMNIPGYRKYDKELYYQAKGILENEFVVSPPDIPKAEPTLSEWVWKEFLPIGSDAYRYAQKRGLTDEQIIKFKIGSASSLKDGMVHKRNKELLLSLPTFHDGSLMGIKLRRLDKEAKYRYFTYPGTMKGLFNYDAVKLTDEPVLVLKGEIAVAVADRFGFLACAPTGGEGSYVNEVLSCLSLSRRVVVVGDNDANLQTRVKMREAAIRRAFALGGKAYFPPEKYKDIDEWLLNDDRAADCIKRWLYEGL